ncbi:MAG: hypothetical protein GFH27_549309n167 [Chloroflexi bacterium AL-W]|nr:hypothetical protein [Chloroflexi bacterium AL-N1]NOK68187.1 hypothetical protein [Chloroflexi bacterium AL-N10]NOK73527.1 hypothetical protein [Chloroflexi bacterium AL-N5]NOK84039.1 hypothetical protein [Chloroflexi bacterium AL-W]NOK87858.1 hypothetical protein [Chloroflexi bacterium AL-N15]
MAHLPYSHDQLVRLAYLTHADITGINQRRHPHNRLGFAYQLAFVRLFNRFPSQDCLDAAARVTDLYQCATRHSH